MKKWRRLLDQSWVLIVMHLVVVIMHSSKQANTKFTTCETVQLYDWSKGLSAALLIPRVLTSRSGGRVIYLWPVEMSSSAVSGRHHLLHALHVSLPCFRCGCLGTITIVDYLLSKKLDSSHLIIYSEVGLVSRQYIICFDILTIDHNFDDASEMSVAVLSSLVMPLPLT